MRVFFSIIFVLLVAALTVQSRLAHQYRIAALEVCDLIGAYYYRRDESDVRQRIDKCRRDANAQSFLSSRFANRERINRRLASFNVSHLKLNSPNQTASLWINTGLDTGIRARIIEADLVIFRILPGSAAERASFKVGNVIVAVDGDKNIGSADVETLRGRYEITTAAGRRLVDIEPSVILDDRSPRLESLDAGTGLLTLRSFLPQYFERPTWSFLSQNLNRYSRLIIDLRDNGGGSFPAMLRALSPFRCTMPFIGQIRTGKTDAKAVELADDLDASIQWNLIRDTGSIKLRTTRSYGCFSGDIIVLIDDGTLSTAEIFADALRSRDRARIWGQPTGGQVVMARLFETEGFADGSALNIPIAQYTAIDGREIESRGVVPEKQLYYDLTLARAGVDSWLHVARTSLNETRE